MSAPTSASLAATASRLRSRLTGVAMGAVALAVALARPVAGQSTATATPTPTPTPTDPGGSGNESAGAPGGGQGGGGGGGSGSGSGSGGGGGEEVALTTRDITDAILRGLEEFLRGLFEPIESFVGEYGTALIEVVVATPTPNRVFAMPTNPPWPRIYRYYWGDIVPMALLLFALTAALVILLETTSTLFSTYHRAQLKRRLAVALLGILSWWWISAFALRLVDAVTLTIAPSLADITLFEAASFAVLGTLGTLVSLGVDLVLFGAVALLYVLRQLVLYLYTLFVPLLLVLWVPGVGPFRLLTGFARQLASLYVPFLFLPVPVALLLRLGQLLGDSVTPSLGGFGTWIAALVVPFVAALTPIVLVWQTGRITAVAGLAGRHASRRRAHDRADRVRDRGAQATLGTRNAVRGARGDPPVTADGQQQLGSGDSRAHAATARMRRGLARLRESREADGEADRYEPTEFRSTGDADDD